MPKISVIVPVYNVEKNLPRCIDSILSQSFTDFELLLIDDGSPDNCGKICDEYAAKDSRVKVFHKPNGGVSSARNLGLDKAQGEWVTFIDSDDYVDVDYLKELVVTQGEYNSDFVATMPRAVQAPHTTTYLPYKDFNRLFIDYKFNYGPTPWGKLYNTNIIVSNDIRFLQNVHSGEDSIFVYHYLLKIKDIVLIYSNRYKYDTSRIDSLSKVIGNYDSTLLGKQEFDRTLGLMIVEMQLEDKAISNLGICEIAFTENVLLSISRIPNRKTRIQNLGNLDLRFYTIFKKPATWKEGVVCFLLKKRLFCIYDFLIYLHSKGN